jgi:hypothetical protein
VLMDTAIDVPRTVPSTSNPAQAAEVVVNNH